MELFLLAGLIELYYPGIIFLFDHGDDSIEIKAVSQWLSVVDVLINVCLEILGYMFCPWTIILVGASRRCCKRKIGEFTHSCACLSLESWVYTFCLYDLATGDK